MRQEPANTTQPENTASGGGRGGPRPGGFSAMGLVVSALLFLCAAWALFVLDVSGLSSSDTFAMLPLPRAASPGEALEAPFKTPPIKVPDEAFAKPEPISPPPLPEEAEKPEPVEVAQPLAQPPPAAPPKPEESAKPSALSRAPAKTLKPAPPPAPARPAINPKNPPREIVERVPEPKAAGAAAGTAHGEPWYSVRAGYSESRARTDTLRQVLAGRGFAKASTERDSDGLYYVRVDEFRFRHLAEETFKELEGMGFEPTLHERTVAK